MALRAARMSRPSPRCPEWTSPPRRTTSRPGSPRSSPGLACPSGSSRRPAAASSSAGPACASPQPPRRRPIRRTQWPQPRPSPSAAARRLRVRPPGPPPRRRGKSARCGRCPRRCLLPQPLLLLLTPRVRALPGVALGSRNCRPSHPRRRPTPPPRQPPPQQRLPAAPRPPPLRQPPLLTPSTLRSGRSSWPPWRPSAPGAPPSARGRARAFGRWPRQRRRRATTAGPRCWAWSPQCWCPSSRDQCRRSAPGQPSASAPVRSQRCARRRRARLTTTRTPLSRRAPPAPARACRPPTPRSSPPDGRGHQALLRWVLPLLPHPLLPLAPLTPLLLQQQRQRQQQQRRRRPLRLRPRHPPGRDAPLGPRSRCACRLLPRPRPWCGRA
mmetsp:Transcript_13879/g.52819  ORF Transcript_13879/g.52819 Transcript_13879/m.52819 type:complete len:384 (+) Transcript_13879:1049-2200(+)